MKVFKLVFTVLFLTTAVAVSAQSSCDKLFANGVKLQQTMTVNSQKRAINFFEKAKVCYDSQAKKDLCDQQIKACRNIIEKLRVNRDPVPDSRVRGDSVEALPKTNVAPKAKTEPRDVQLSIDCTYLKFKGKGGEFKKAKVKCNYPDWKITEMPDWVNCSKNENGEIVVEAEKNPTKEERSGIVKIECGDKTATLTIIQEKLKKFGII